MGIVVARYEGSGAYCAAVAEVENDGPSLGAGEAAHGPTAAAIGNAVRDALGVAVRDLPLTPENVVAALA